MEHNPYAPTKAALNESPFSDDPDASVGLRLASRWRRFANMWIDAFAIDLLSAVLDGVIAVVTGRGQEPSFGSSLVTRLLLGTFVWLGYYVLMEGLSGRTLGKLITGTRVVTESGDRPSFGQIVKRTWLRAVPLEAFSFFGARPGWHDRWSKTRVIRVRPA
jgi:uncharacterized RDD family membrane protein YckC